MNEVVKILLFTSMTVTTLATRPKACTRVKFEKINGNVKFGFFSGYVIKDRIPKEGGGFEIEGAKNETECVKQCVGRRYCRTIAVRPVNSRKVKCNILDRDVHRNDTIYEKGSKIIAVGTPACQSSPCQNGGTCRVNDTAVGFKCHCLPNFSGKRCEKPKYPPYFSDPTNTISFDDYQVTGTRRTKATFISKKSNGQVVSVHFANSPVYMINTTKVDPGMEYTLKNMPFLSNPFKDKKFTIGCWIRVHDDYITGKPPFNKGPFKPVRIITSDRIRIKFGGGMLEGTIDGMDGWTYLKANVKPVKGKWYHVGMRIGTETFAMFMDGKIVKSQDIPSMSAYDSGNGALTILRRDSFRGIVFLDEIKVFNGAKSDTFIRHWYKYEKKNYL